MHLFLVKQPGEQSKKVPTVLYFHGNAGNIGHRLLNVQGLYTSIGCNVALLEYRGYGRSEGSPSEEGIYMDAQVSRGPGRRRRINFWNSNPSPLTPVVRT